MFRILLATVAVIAPVSAAQGQNSGLDSLITIVQEKSSNTNDEAVSDDSQRASPADRVRGQAQRQLLDRAPLTSALTVECRDEAAIRSQIDSARTLLAAARDQNGAALKDTIARARAHLGTALAATDCPRGNSAVGKRTDDTAYGVISQI